MTWTTCTFNEIWKVALEGCFVHWVFFEKVFFEKMFAIHRAQESYLLTSAVGLMTLLLFFISEAW